LLAADLAIRSRPRERNCVKLSSTVQVVIKIVQHCPVYYENCPALSSLLLKLSSTVQFIMKIVQHCPVCY